MRRASFEPDCPRLKQCLSSLKRRLSSRSVRSTGRSTSEQKQMGESEVCAQADRRRMKKGAALERNKPAVPQGAAVFEHLFRVSNRSKWRVAGLCSRVPSGLRLCGTQKPTCANTHNPAPSIFPHPLSFPMGAAVFGTLVHLAGADPIGLAEAAVVVSGLPVVAAVVVPGDLRRRAHITSADRERTLRAHIMSAHHTRIPRAHIASGHTSVRAQPHARIRIHTESGT